MGRVGLAADKVSAGSLSALPQSGISTREVDLARQKEGLRSLLKRIFPDRKDRREVAGKVRELVYQVRVVSGSGSSLGRKRRTMDAAIHRLSEAADTLNLLRLNWVGVAAQIELDFDVRPFKLMQLEDDLRRASAALRKASKTMQLAKRPFRDDAIARLVAFVWERTGQPHHAIVADLLRPILGPEYGHPDWYRRHKDPVQWHRDKMRTFGFP